MNRPDSFMKFSSFLFLAFPVCKQGSRNEDGRLAIKMPTWPCARVPLSQSRLREGAGAPSTEWGLFQGV